MIRSEAVFLQVINSRLLALTSEFAENILRAAHSTFIKETWDIAALLMSPDGEVISCPKEVAAKRLGMTLRTWLETKPVVNPGDIFISNDPVSSGLATHLNDLFLWKPVYFPDGLIGFALAFVHVSDVGGAVPGSISPASTEMYQEGVRIPPVKLFERGEIVEAVHRIIVANTRVPRQVWGDLTAVVGALNVFERRLAALASDYTRAEFADATSRLLALAEARARDLIRAIPDGRYGFVDYIDGVPGRDPIRIALTLRIEGDDVVLDFTGSEREVAAAYNVFCQARGDWALARAFTDYFQTLDPALPWNSGLVRPIRIEAEPGSIFRPSPGAACGGRVSTYFRVYYMILGALSKAIPGALPASGSGSTGVMLVATRDRATGARRINVGQAIFGGGGARAISDGFDGNEMVSWYLRNIPIELLEHELNVRFHDYAIAPGTGGPGRFRGGHGTRVVVEFLAPATVTIRGLQRFQFRAWGTEGGRAGAKGEIVLNRGTEREERIDSISVLHFEAGETLALTSPGGGGLGDPALRPVEAVVRDVEDGLLPPDRAREDFGVVIVEGVADERATEAARKARPPAPDGIDFGEERLSFERGGRAGMIKRAESVG